LESCVISVAERASSSTTAIAAGRNEQPAKPVAVIDGLSKAQAVDRAEDKFGWFKNGCFLLMVQKKYMLMVQESLDAFCCIIFRLVMLVMESQAPILNNFQVNYLAHSY
jgi:hypothetical protein